MMNGGCSGECHNTDGSYYCECGEGSELFMTDGQSGFFVKEGETGHTMGDVYQFNHTCIRESSLYSL